MGIPSDRLNEVTDNNTASVFQDAVKKGLERKAKEKAILSESSPESTKKLTINGKLVEVGDDVVVEGNGDIRIEGNGDNAPTHLTVLGNGGSQYIQGITGNNITISCGQGRPRSLQVTSNGGNIDIRSAHTRGSANITNHGGGVKVTNTNTGGSLSVTSISPDFDPELLAALEMLNVVHKNRNR
jgi:hypothetical protein